MESGISIIVNTINTNTKMRSEEGMHLCIQKEEGICKLYMAGSENLEMQQIQKIQYKWHR